MNPGARLICLVAAAGLLPVAARADAVTPAPAAATVLTDAALPATALALPATSTAYTATPFSESVLRRTETVFFIALPFTTLYSAVITMAVAFAIEGKRFTLDSRVVVPAVVLSLASTSYVVWRDHRAAAAAGASPGN